MSYRVLPDPHYTNVFWRVVDGVRQHFSMLPWDTNPAASAWFGYKGMWVEHYPATEERLALRVALSLNPLER